MTLPADRHGYAGFATRLTGLAADSLLLTVAGLLVSGLPPMIWRQMTGDDPQWLVALSGALAGLLPWAYFAACWALSGATIGALLVGTRTCRSDGTTLGPLRAAVRALVGLVIAPVWLVGLLGVLTDGRRRAWHDRLFGTVVRRAGSTVAPIAGRPSVGPGPSRPGPPAGPAR